MKNTPLVSIIIPVYNVEQYLDQCMETVLGQTYSNLDIILVDDGSKDKSSQMCDEYVAKDKRVKVLHKENGGLSSARNKGLELAKGQYIIFPDPDDYLEKDYIQTIINTIKTNNWPDFIFF